MRFLSLFFTFFKIGLFSFGGGYGMLPLMEQETVGKGLLAESEFMNFLAISESTPGPIAINMATFIGTNQAGFFGAVCCTLGAIMPSIIIILLIVALLKNFLKYEAVKCVMSGIKPAIVGLIFTTGVFLGLNCVLPFFADFSTQGFSIKSLMLIICLFAFYFIYKKIRKKNLSPILLIICSALAGMLMF